MISTRLGVFTNFLPRRVAWTDSFQKCAGVLPGPSGRAHRLTLTGIKEKLNRLNSSMANPSGHDSVLRQVVTSPKCPAAIGPYSPAILANNTLYISGQLGIDASKGGDLVSGGAEKEAEQALLNLGSILRAANADYINVVKVTVLFADLKDFQIVNQVYAKFFTHDPPARAAYQVAALPKGAKIEIEAIAVIGNVRNE